MSSLKRDKSQDVALVGTTLAGKYKVLELLGQGGFGSVFLVEIVAGMVGEKLALKLIPQELSSNAKVKAQFMNEIRVAMRMVNKYIVQIRDVGETETGQLYYTMDYCPGKTLAEVLKEETTLPVPRTVSITLRILEALKTAHSSAVIHRDLKPANVMVFTQNSHESARVLDFGIATAIGSSEDAGKTFVGSPHYMPPEQFLNEDLGYYTDTYAVGVILYECVTGKRPYSGQTPQQVYDDLKSRPVTPPDEVNSNLKAYPGINALICRALERNPELRFQTAREFSNELKTVIEGKEAQKSATPSAKVRAVRRRRPARVKATPQGSNTGVLVAVGAVVALLALGAFFMMSNGNPNGTNGGNAGLTAPVVKSPTIPRSPDPALSPADPEPPPIYIPPPVAVNPSSRVDERRVVVVTPKAPEINAEEAVQKARQKSQQLMLDAIQEFKAEKWLSVRDICNVALDLNPENLEAYRLRGQAELQLGMHRDALGSFVRITDRATLEELDVNLLLFMIEAHENVAPVDTDAISSLLEEARIALGREPENHEAAITIVLHLENEGREKELMELVEQQLGRSVDHQELKRLHQEYFIDRPRERNLQAREIHLVAVQALEEGDFDRAATMAWEGYQISPLPELGLTMAEAHLAAGKPGETLGALKRVGNHLSEDSLELVRVGVLFAQAYLEQIETGGADRKTKVSQALENLDVVFELLNQPRIKAPDMVAKARAYQARCFAHRGDLSRVEEAIKLARAANDRNVKLIYHEAESYFITGQNSRGPDRGAAFLACIRRLTWYNDFKEAKRDPQGYLLMGLAYLRMGGKVDNYKKAVHKFEEAGRYGMDTAELFNSWGEAYHGTRDYTRAGQKYRLSFRAKPAADSSLNSAKSFLEANQRKSAEDILKLGLERFPKNEEIKTLLDSIRR